MNRAEVIRLLTWLSLGLAAVFGVITILLFILAAVLTDGMELGTALFAALITGGLGAGAWFLAHYDQNDGVGTIAEQQLLNEKQRRELRKARGAVLMEKALIDVEQERANIVHKLQEDANDPDKPPYLTSFEQTAQLQSQSSKIARIKSRKGKYRCIGDGCDDVTDGPDDPFCRYHDWSNVS